jgi:type I restriction enzyme S subunit
MNFINNDSAVPGLNRNQAYSNQFFLPPEPLIQEFAKIVDPHFEARRIILRQNDVLLATRSLLLPRLISGNLSVDDYDRQLPPGLARESIEKSSSGADA